MRTKTRHVWIPSVVVLGVLLAAASFWWFSPGQQQHRRNQALIAACTAGDTKAVQDVLAAGADADARDEAGLTPLMYAARGNRPNMADPAATDHPAIVQLLLKSGADVNASTGSGFVALFGAARYGHHQVVKVLLENGADVNARDGNGMTAMKWANANRTASPENYERVIALLKEAGAKE